VVSKNWLIHIATNSTPFDFDGAFSLTGPWRVDPFPQLGGKHVLFPFQSRTGKALIESRKLRPLLIGEKIPGPYVP
jgi:hypothetical protein